MSIKTIKISNIDVEIEKKNIKNLHLGVYPPNGRVRVAAPMKTTDESIRLMIISKISWIKKQQNKFQSQLRQSQREYVSGESHYLWGTRYLLNVIYHKGAAKVIIRNKKFIDLYVRDGTSRDQRERVMTNWYREQIKAVIPDIIQKWEPLMNVAVDEWRDRKSVV